MKKNVTPCLPTDIEILPGAVLPKPKMYSMTPPELKEMRAYIEKNLKQGFIQPTRSRLATPVLFREKMEACDYE